MYHLKEYALTIKTNLSKLVGLWKNSLKSWRLRIDSTLADGEALFAYRARKAHHSENENQTQETRQKIRCCKRSFCRI